MLVVLQEVTNGVNGMAKDLYGNSDNHLGYNRLKFSDMGYILV